MKFDELANTAVWALAAVAMVLGIAAIFRKPLTELIGRTKKAGFGDKAIEFADSQAPAAEQKQQIEAPIKDDKPIAPSPQAPPPPDPVQAVVEAEIRKALDDAKMSPDLERAWLTRALAGVRIMRAHEITYRLIVGSQVGLVVSTNAFPQTRAKAQEMYETAKTAFPDIYAAFTFQIWLNFPVNQGLISIDGDSIQIAPLGRDFLHYLVANGMTTPKAG